MPSEQQRAIRQQALALASSVLHGAAFLRFWDMRQESQDALIQVSDRLRWLGARTEQDFDTAWAALFGKDET
jgi:hypothetical protein